MLDLNGRRIILASASPRRAQLLKLIGLEFEVVQSNCDESGESYTFPEVQVLELSERKASMVAEQVEDGLIVGVDTVVALGDKIFGKPKDKSAAQEMLRQLSGQTHTVYTGFTLIDQPSGWLHSDYERTEVVFRKINDAEISRYVETESPLDKAGAYGIQDKSAVFVRKVNGCFYNVVGLPVTKFYVALRDFLASRNGT